MFFLYRFQRRRRSIEKEFDAALFALEGNKTEADQNERDELANQFQQRLDHVDLNIELVRTSRLIVGAQALELQVPRGNDPEMWNSVSNRRVLSPKGRSYLRKLIDDEKTRRRDVRAWWWKNVLIPAITALTGLAGVITGLIAVLHAKK